MQQPVRDRPDLHRSYAGCSRIGIDGDQRYLAGGLGPQPNLGIIHNISSQWTEGRK